MADLDFERRVLIEAEKWFRYLLRQDGMGNYEKDLFLAVAEWRKSLEQATHIPRSSKIPSTMLPPPFPRLPKESEIRARVEREEESGLDLITTRPVPRDEDISLRTTKPVPPGQQTYLVKKMNLPPLPLLTRTKAS